MLPLAINPPLVVGDKPVIQHVHALKPRNGTKSPALIAHGPTAEKHLCERFILRCTTLSGFIEYSICNIHLRTA